MKSLHLTAAIAGLGLFTVLPAAAQQADTSRVARRDSSYTNLKEATVTATRLVFITRKDTVIYDMDALGATKGDMLGDMINRMPGLELRNGVLYFRGRAINRLLVNGFDFKRNDTQSALRELPAYIIKHIKAYEDKTDEAKATGIDDGVRQQVVNVILKREYMGVWTGNADVAGGTDERWRIRTFASTFTDNFRATLYGGFTNTGQFQSASNTGEWGDNGGAGSSSGNTKYMKPSFYLMWKNGSNAYTKGYVGIEASGSWDYRGHKDYNYNEMENFLDDGTSRFTVGDTRTRNDEKIWGGNIYVTLQPTATTHIEIGPSYSYTHMTARTTSRNGEWTVPVQEMTGAVLDSLVAHLADGWPSGGAVNSQMSEAGFNRHTHNFNNWLWATQRLTKNNMRVNLRSSLSYNYSANDRNELTAYRYYRQTDVKMDPLYNRYIDAGSHSFSTQNFLDFNIPMKLLETLRFTYGYTRNDNHSNNRGYRLERLGDVFASYEDYIKVFGMLPPTVDWQQIARDVDITLNSDSYNYRHWGEVQTQYNKGYVYASMQYTVRTGRDGMDYRKGDFAPLTPRKRVTEQTVHPFLRYKNDSIGTFQLDYQYDITPQSISYDITLPNNSDPLYITLGNPGMKDRRNHQLNFSYQRTFPQNAFLYASASWGATANNVVSRQTYDKTTGVTTTQPTTINGTWYASYSTSYNRAIDKQQHITMNSNINYTFNNSPNFTTGTAREPLRRTDRNHTIWVGAGLNFRYGKFYGNLRVNGGYYIKTSSPALAETIHQWNGTYSAGVQYTFPLDFVLRTNIDVNHRTGVASQTLKRFRPIWNGTLTKSLLRDKSLSLQLEASDILNRRDQSWAYVNNDNRGSGYAMTVARFVMLHVIYNFSTKKRQ